MKLQIPPRPDRSAWARRNRVPLSILFMGCLAIAALAGNLFAGLAGIGGFAWLAYAHLPSQRG